jgi:tetratricopeptide (TPR) repeat protein
MLLLGNKLSVKFSKIIQFNLFYLLLTLALSVSLSACSGGAYSKGRLLPGFTLGDFSGSGALALAAKLESPASSSKRGKKNYPILSGTAVFTTRAESGEEKVITFQEGNENLYWRKDPLTNQVWTVKAKVKREVPKNYETTLVLGSLKVVWELRDREKGELISQGEDQYLLSKSLGGYPEDLKRKDGAIDSLRDSATSSASGKISFDQDSPAFLAIKAGLLDSLSQTAADKLLLTLSPKGLKTAHARDSRSLNAERLATLGRWEEAAIIWQELIQENPYYHPALYNLGLFYETKGDLKSAWNSFRSAFLSSQETLYRNALARLSLILNRSGISPKVRDGFL